MSTDFLLALLLWFVRAFVSSIICLILGYIGIRGMTYITKDINEFKRIKGDSLATSLFISGYIIFAGLVVYGSMVNPFFLSQSVIIGAFFNLERLLVVILSFIVSLIFGWIFYEIFARLKLFGINLDDVNGSPIAVGIFMFCWEIFLGLIIYASLVVPLG